jgi:hypothetical protein
MSPPPRDSSAAALLPAPDDEDLVERAFRLAPLDDEPETAAELEAMAAAPERWVPHAEVVAELEARRPR